jgi:hypothetical protein
MKTREIDWEVLRKWEERLDVAYRILKGQQKSGCWTLVCDEALRDLDAVRREIDWEVFDTVKETTK